MKRISTFGQRNRAFVLLGIICVFLVVFSTFLVPLPKTLASVGGFVASYSANLPVIDGSVTDPEWNDANSYAITLSGSSDTFPSTIYFKHDGTTIYVGLKVSAGTHTYDEFDIFFDEGNDGSYGSGTRDGVLTRNQEDAKAVDQLQHRWDGYYRGPGLWMLESAAQATIDFDAKCGFVVDHWEVEYAIPFVGNDGGPLDFSDLNCTVTDTIGIKILYGCGAATPYYYPSGGSQYDIETYTTLSFMLPGNVIPEVPLGTIVASAAMIGALGAYFAIPKLRKKPVNIIP